MNKVLKEFQEKDICVICKKKSEENKETHINNRFYYVECAGQLCVDCYGKIYKKD